MHSRLPLVLHHSLAQCTRRRNARRTQRQDRRAAIHRLMDDQAMQQHVQQLQALFAGGSDHDSAQV